MKQERFTYAPPKGAPVELETLAAEGPFCVGRVYDHINGKVVNDLYWIYLKEYGAKFGPFFADIALAMTATRKILKKFKPAVFSQPLVWIRRQAAMQEWVEQNIGKAEDLIGAEWSH